MYQTIVKGWMKHVDFTILDCISLEISFFVAYIIRNGIPTGGFSEEYEKFILAIALLHVCTIFFLNSYENIIRRDYIAEIKQILVHCILLTVGLIVWMFLMKESRTYSRQVVLTMYPLSVCIMTVSRMIWKRVIRRWKRERKDLRKILVITTNNASVNTIDSLLQPYRDYHLAACILYDSDNKIGTKIKQVPVVTDREHIIQFIHESVIDEVYINLPGYESETEHLQNLLVNMGVVVHISLTQYTLNLESSHIERFSGGLVLSSGMKFAAPRQLFFKRLLDICGSVVGLMITGIAFVFFAPIIKKQSPGPVFFSQERVGRNGRHFKIYKFRTMYPDAEERKKELMAQNKMNGYMFKMDNDPRIIPIGDFLRKCSIDELPQFWNVLKGDMSLVGTRPPTVDEYEKYEFRHRKRLAMKPGLTGMWQISGRSDITDFEEVVALDAKYITEWTLGLDIKILWKTVRIVLLRNGAV